MPFLRRISGDQLWRNFAAIQLPDGAHARLSAIRRSIPTSCQRWVLMLQPTKEFAPVDMPTCVSSGRFHVVAS